MIDYYSIHWGFVWSSKLVVSILVRLFDFRFKITWWNRQYENIFKQSTHKLGGENPSWPKCQPHLSHIPATSRLHLSHNSATPMLHLNHISATSQPHLCCISGTSRPYLKHISTTHGPHPQGIMAVLNLVFRNVIVGQSYPPQDCIYFMLHASNITGIWYVSSIKVSQLRLYVRNISQISQTNPNHDWNPTSEIYL